MADQLRGTIIKLDSGDWGVQVEGEMEIGTQTWVMCTEEDGTERVFEAKCLWTGDNPHGSGKISRCIIVYDVWRVVPCLYCENEGVFPNGDKCHKCNGTGQIEVPSTVIRDESSL